ncbi:centrosomal protein of 78 kDa [Lampris incognitus]|uniref:centrosomal protein of 78 kDa n=1 Tax=Lampris incognitus TaxID=2546036 RepID=UPI0024B61FC1|nr:centrosomal protein of 78 kDa [Lampris incognitus]
MVQDSAQMRQRGAEDFMAYYEYACARQDSVPLPAVKMNLSEGILDFSGDRVKLTDWPPILNSISINKHLGHIAIISTYQARPGARDTDSRHYKSINRKKIPAIRSKDIMLKLCKAIRDCLTVSSKLKTLYLNGLPLSERDLITLTKGLAKSVSLEKLSLANCPISDEGLEVICQSVKYSANIKVVDFTGCNLTWRGAEHMANIIKHQGMQRHGKAWAESLRYRQPEFEGMGGLRRITLSCNTLIGDRGAAVLANELAEDLWVKALDLQKCGLSNEGARCLLEALRTNSTLCVLDIRNNPLVDNVLIKTTIEKVLMNADSQPQEYYWIKPSAFKEHPKLSAPRRAQPGTLKGKATFRIAPPRLTSAGKRSPSFAWQSKHHSHSSQVPWRAAARAGRQRGLPPGTTVTEQNFQGAATVKVTLESDSEKEEEEKEKEKLGIEIQQSPSSLSLRHGLAEQQLKRLQMELEECRLRLAEERKARLKAESRLMEYQLKNSRHRSLNLSLSGMVADPGSAPAPAVYSALEDEAVLDSIESSFNKFHAFLDLLKDAGLGQLASIVGINQSDFCPLGRPQLSSTVGPGSGAVTGNGEGYKDIGAKPDAISLISNTLPALTGGQADSFTPRLLSAPREFLMKDKALESCVSQASGPAIDPNVDLEGGGEEPDQYSKPEAQLDSGSERSCYSQKSYGSGLPGNRSPQFSGSYGDVSKPSNVHNNGNSHNSYSNSHRSNCSHECRFNYSNSYSSIHSNTSYSNGFHGDLSVRSSLGEIMSERADSKESLQSKSRGEGRRITAGHHGSEGAEKKAYLEPETLGQIRYLAREDRNSDGRFF